MTLRPASTLSSRGPVPWKDVALLAGAGLVALYPLARFWSLHPDYFFGWGVPFLAAYLLFERWPTRPPQQSPQTFLNSLTFAIILAAWSAALLLARLLEETEPDWRPGLWLAMGLYLGGVLAWFWLRGGFPWLRHFLVPIAFLFLSVPWPFNFEAPLVQGLSRLNAALVADSLVLADVPARAMGNTILLATGQLGVEEACSGIRSLQAVVMMSVFLGEFYHLSRSRRFLLLGFALLLALAGNYARLLFLAWRGAHAGIASVGALHDSAGFGILVFTVLGLWIICLALPRGEAAAPFSNASREKKIFPAHPASQPAIWAAALLLSALLSEVCTQAWYAYRENSTPSLPAWTVLLPARAPNFHPLPISPASHALLGDAASNTAAWSDERGWRWNALWFRYDSRTADKIIFDLHNPEACLPAAGFRETRDDGASTQIIRGIPLRTQRYLFTTDAGRSMYVFWIAYLLHGELDDFQHHQLLNGDSLPAFFARGFSWCRDAWHGLRGTEAQTLEITIAGPDNAADAQRTYLDFIDTAIEPQPRR